jgi:isopentenyl-diphosphate delta-isomerase
MQPTSSQSEISNRKVDHLTMAGESQTHSQLRDERFFYEPLLSAHPQTPKQKVSFGQWSFDFPLWISSMTGGADHARTINSRLAAAAEEYSLGMGLGSLRPLLDNRQSRADFDVKHLMPTRPLFGNLGIAQLEELLEKKETQKIVDLIGELKLDGLIIHVNPLQEWFQPQGDRFKHAPLETIEHLLQKTSLPVIVKEVGHGMGPRSLEALMRLKLLAIEFGAFGGTNFSLLETKRGSLANGFVYVGHTASEMVSFVSDIQKSHPGLSTKHFIISGGIKDVLTGFSFTQQLPHSLMGMANSVLEPARKGERDLLNYLLDLKEQYAMAEAFLKVRGV